MGGEEACDGYELLRPIKEMENYGASFTLKRLLYNKTLSYN